LDSNHRNPGVCLLTETFHPLTGGGETQARALAVGLARRGFDVTLMTRRIDRQLPRVSSMDGVTVRRLGPTGAAHLKKWGLCLTALVELIRRRDDFHVILVCGYRVLGIPAMIASRLLGRPCVLKADSLGEHSGAFFDPGLRRFGLSHESWPVTLALRIRNGLLSPAAGFVAISGAITEELQAAGIPALRVHDIPNSVDTDFYQPVNQRQKAAARDRLEIEQDRTVAVFTGRLVSTKGLPTLLRAWQGVVNSIPDALLLLVGSGGLGLQNCEPELHAFVDRHNLGRQIRFIGSVADVRDYLRAADLFVFPSRRESFGISVIEAMACGLPVIASDIPGLSDVVVPDVTARVIPPENEDAIRETIISLLNDSELRARLGTLGRQRVEEHFSESHVIDSYIGLIRDLANHDGPSEA
jgi:glycosyltransferase involved in cell wall biosynthesis